MREAAVTDLRPTRRRLGKLTLLEQIGEGGMARIHLARAEGIGGFEKLVVVKEILPRLAEDHEFVERFFQEARLAATLHHPNIAAVYDVDTDGDSYFYSMEYVRGRDLLKVARRAKKRERPLTIEEVVTIIVDLCAGLHHAHTQRNADGEALGIVHRDVSHSNVLLSYDGAVKLADFGVAKARVGSVATTAGQLRGKIAYMSPEQTSGEALDRRSDVFAVGIVMWELLTMRRLFRGDSELAILRRIREDDAPRVSSACEVPERLDEIVIRALQRSPALRYPSADALRADLEAFAEAERLTTSPRVVAKMMEDLFGEDQLDEAVWVNLQEAAVDGVDSATVTIESSQTEELDRPTRSWWPAAAALAVSLGGGTLYVASRPEPPPVEASKTRVDARPEPPPNLDPLPVLQAPPAEPAPKPESHSDEDDANGEHVGSKVVEPAEAKRPARKRRAKKRRRKDKSPASSVDLDAALPPGFGGS